MMKYILAIVFLMHAVGACGMDNDSKAKKLQALHAMGADNRAANRNMATLMPAGDRDEDRALTLHLVHRELKKQEYLYDLRLAAQEVEQHSLAAIAKRNDEQIKRMVCVVEKQTSTISTLNGLILAILQKTYKADTRVAKQEQNIIEMKQITSDHVESLLKTVGGQTELISRQTGVISELINRVEGLSQTLAKLQKMLSRLQSTIMLHEEMLEKHNRLHTKARQMLMAATAVFTNQEIDAVIKLLEEPDMPVVESDQSDSAFERRILSESKSLGDDSEAIAQYNLRLVPELVSQQRLRDYVPPADLEEAVVPADDEKLSDENPDEKKLTASGWELVAQYEEDIVPPKNKEEAGGE